MDKKIKVTLKRRPATERLRVILLGIGLKKTNSTKVLSDTASIRGMVAKVSHLVTVEEA
ncbi:MAG: 50S ribosomal protein L30 [Deltaproteobacteria bacterium]|nr:50S ribosomal protein L30 [Deltaproteobacteria bacterium]